MTVSIDDKLFRIYEEAHATAHKSRSELARAVAAKQLIEFSTERNGERQYHTWGTILEYVVLLAEYGLLTPEQVPAIKTARISRRGFDLTLGESVENYALSNSFSIDRVREAVRTLIQRTPAQIPTPTSVFSVLQLPVNSQIFTRSISIKAYQVRAGVNTKQKNIVFVSDILRE